MSAGGSVDGDRRIGPRVLVPRDGDWGRDVAELVRGHGAIPVIVPLIGFTRPDDPRPLDAALHRLSSGDFDWLIVTSATTVAVLVERRIAVPRATRVAALGNATRTSLTAAGISADFVPTDEQSAAGIAAELPGAAGHVLLPQSDLADPALAANLRARGLDVVAVTAYRNVPIAVSPSARAELDADGIDVVLVTSDSVAAQVAAQLAPLPSGTLVACIGPRTAAAAERVGLRVDAVAARRSIEALVLTALAHVDGT